MAVDIPAADLTRRQRERLPLAIQRAQAKLDGLAVGNADVTPLLKASQKAKTVEQRVVWLQRAASAGPAVGDAGSLPDGV